MNEEHKESLYKLIRLKDIISKFIWYILTGRLVSSICLNYVSTSKCGTSVQEDIQAKHDEYEQNMKTIEDPNQTIYTTTD